MLPPPHRAPRILLRPLQSCRGLNKRNIRPVSVQQRFSDWLQKWSWAQGVTFGVGGLGTVAKSGPIHADQGMSTPNLSANSRDEVQLHAYPSLRIELVTSTLGSHCMGDNCSSLRGTSRSWDNPQGLSPQGWEHQRQSN